MCSARPRRSSSVRTVERDGSWAKREPVTHSTGTVSAASGMSARVRFMSGPRGSR